MKKILSALLILICVFSVMSFTTVLAVEQKPVLWEWEPYGDGVSLKEYKGTQTDVYISETEEKDGVEYNVL